jgi:hypothetical protein
MSDNDATAEAMAGDSIAAGVMPEVESAATVETIAVPASTAVVGPRTNGGAFVGARRLLRFAFAVALLVGGVALGYRVYLTNQPVQAVTGDPGIVGVATPAVVQELVGAIEADDGDRIRSALQAEMFNRYTSEIERFGIAMIENVKTLGTYADGDQTATAIVIEEVTKDRNPFAYNLVELTQNGQIVRLR